jgi:GT2 family glycosyltransferase
MGRRDFWAVGGFDTAFSFAGAEDRHFCLNWIDRGRKLIYLPQAVVYHFHHLDLRGFLRQHMRYGRGSRLLRQRSGSAGFFRPGFYLSLVGRGIRRRPDLRGLQLSALLLAAQAATAGGYLAQGLRMAGAAARQPGALRTKPPVGE